LSHKQNMHGDPFVIQYTCLQMFLTVKTMWAVLPPGMKPHWGI